MVRSFAPKKKIYKRRQWKRKYTSKRRLISKIGNTVSPVHKFVRWIATPLTLGGANSPTYAPYCSYTLFRLNQAVNSYEFKNLYDQYMITHAQVRVHFKATGDTQYYPKFYYYIDPDNADTIPTTLNDFRERMNCKVVQLNPNRPVVINLKPAILSEAYRSAVSTAYAPKWKQWITTVQDDVPHYGLQWCIDDFTNTTQSIYMEVKLWMRFKNPK